MKKRLRKKKYCGEFTEYMVELTLHFVDDFNKSKYLDDFLDKFLDFIDDNELCCCGIYDKDGVGHFHVSAFHRDPFEEEHRQIIIDWLKEEKEISDFTVSELEDAWN